MLAGTFSNPSNPIGVVHGLDLCSVAKDIIPIAIDKYYVAFPQ